MTEIVANENCLVTLKALKYHADMSEETLCFSANIYLNDKKVGEVKNQGHGGPNYYDWSIRNKKTKEFSRNSEAEKEIEAWADSQDITYEMSGKTHTVTSGKLDWVIDEMVQDLLELRDLKRWCKTKTVFQLAGDTKGAWQIIDAPYDQGMKDHLKKKYPKITRLANEEILTK